MSEMKKYIFLLPLFAGLLAACANRNFTQQKFTELKPLKVETYALDIQQDTTHSPTIQQIEKKLLAHDSVFVQTEDQLLLLRSYAYDSLYQEVCMNDYVPVSLTKRKEHQTTVFIEKENIGDDRCFYLEDTDLIEVDGKTYSPYKQPEKSFNRGYKSNLPEPSDFPTVLLVFTILSALLSVGFFIFSFFTLNNAEQGCSGFLIAAFWALILAIFGSLLALISLILLIFFFIQLDQYIKYKKRK